MFFAFVGLRLPKATYNLAKDPPKNLKANYGDSDPPPRGRIAQEIDNLEIAKAAVEDTIELCGRGALPCGPLGLLSGRGPPRRRTRLMVPPG